jgi:ATP-dependent DNA helicase RecG
MRKSETIEELLNAKEGESYQFKEAKTHFDFTETAHCLCALANCGGGKLIFGITDKRPRQVVGSKACDQPERTRKDLIDKLHVMVDFQLYNHEEKRVLIFDVASRPAGLPAQVDGISWWYKGDSLIPMPPDVLRAIYEETGHDFSKDVCPDATVKDLDETAIDAFRANWVAKSGNKQIKNLSLEQLLRDSGAITEDGVTYAALALLGTHAALRKHLSQAEIVFEYRSSEAAGPAAQREEFMVGFFACYNRIWELINLRNNKQHYQEGLFVFDIPTFNERVVREALLNAVSHRNYQLSGSVFVRQYGGKLIVESPGGFPAGITPENILYRQSPRNKRIAELLAICGLVERSGQGMDLMCELCVRESKELPNFSGSDAYLVKLTLNGLVLDKRLLSFIKKIGEKRQELLSTDDLLVIDALFYGKPLNDILRERLKRLVEMGIIEHMGRDKYVLARGLYKATGKSGVHTRLTGLDRETNKELLLKHIRANGDKGAPLKELQQVLPGHSHNQLQVLMRELREEGRIFCKGKTKAARWFLLDSMDKIESKTIAT